MPPQTPLLLLDNVFDTVTQYPSGTLTASSERVGYEADRVADYRRERTSWQTPSTGGGEYVKVDLGVGVARAVDSLFIDRGHNLWGSPGGIGVDYSDDGTAWTQHTARNVPVAGTLGGDPTSATTFAVTEEGALYSLFATSGAHRYWRFYVGGGFTPAAVIPGLILGLKTQLLGYSATFDEDASERTQESTTSKAGYRGTDKTYSWRTCELDLRYIGATEYDGTIRAAKALLFDRNAPAVIVMDYGTRPERAWMYQFDGTTWSAAKSRVYRNTRIRFREVGASIG